MLDQLQLEIANAAIDLQLRPNDEARFVGGQEHGGFGELDWRSHAPDGNELADVVLHLLQRLGRQAQLVERRSSRISSTTRPMRTGRSGCCTSYSTASIAALSGSPSAMGPCMGP